MGLRDNLKKQSLHVLSVTLESIITGAKWCFFAFVAFFLYVNFGWINVPNTYEGNYLCGEQGIPMSIHGSKISLANYDYDVIAVKGTDIEAYQKDFWIPFVGYLGADSSTRCNTV